jgi:hypothetical protein
VWVKFSLLFFLSIATHSENSGGFAIMLTTSTKSTALVSRSLGGVGVARSNSFSWLLCCLLSVQVLFAQTANAATADDWRSRSIYQIITDRFARTDGSTSSPCNTTAQLYCGGTFQGIINQLDYIQDMGFTAVSFESFPAPQLPLHFCPVRGPILLPGRILYHSCVANSFFQILPSS